MGHKPPAYHKKKYHSSPMPISNTLKILSDYIWSHRASLVAQTVKNLLAMQETQVQSLGWEDPWRREWLPIPAFLPGESQGWKSPAGYSLWGCKESDTTEQLTLYDKDKTKVHTQKCNTSTIYVFDLHHSFSGDIYLYVIFSETLDIWL